MCFAARLALKNRNSAYIGNLTMVFIGSHLMTSAWPSNENLDNKTLGLSR